MKNKCKIKILKQQFEEIIKSSTNNNNAPGNTHFTCSFISMRINLTSIAIFSVSTAFTMVMAFFGVDTTSKHHDMINISFHYI
jgi:hypothetical protein